ncbi:MAG: hypothetical protein AAF228_14035 [Pseudomonadota bacterium]
MSAAAAVIAKGSCGQGAFQAGLAHLFNGERLLRRLTSQLGTTAARNAINTARQSAVKKAWEMERLLVKNDLSG